MALNVQEKHVKASIRRIVTVERRISFSFPENVLKDSWLEGRERFDRVVCSDGSIRMLGFWGDARETLITCFCILIK